MRFEGLFMPPALAPEPCAGKRHPLASHVVPHSEPALEAAGVWPPALSRVPAA